MFEAAQSDVATLRKFVPLQPAPAEAKWSVTTIGTDAVPGPSDTSLWAVLHYSDADYATVLRALKEKTILQSTAAGSPPAWLLADVDLARFRHGSDYVFDGAVPAAPPFASDLYRNGFALTLPDKRILIHFSSQ